MSISVGYGDPATWGPVTSKQDPRYVGFTGYLTITTTIGVGEALVCVTVKVVEDDVEEDSIEVVFKGVEITSALCQDTIDGLANHFRGNLSQIIEENTDHGH